MSLAETAKGETLVGAPWCMFDVKLLDGHFTKFRPTRARNINENVVMLNEVFFFNIIFGGLTKRPFRDIF